MFQFYPHAVIRHCDPKQLRRAKGFYQLTGHSPPLRKVRQESKLNHEEETYEELNRKLPNVGDFVTADDGLKGEVQSVNVLRQLVKVVVEVNDEKEIHEYKAEQLHFKRKHHKNNKLDVDEAELKELEKLEKQDDNKSKLDDN